MKRVEHRIKTPKRRGKLIVTEYADHIGVELTFNRYGRLGDEEQISAYLGPVFQSFDSDPRPIRFHSPDLGQRLIIDTVDGVTFALVDLEPRH